MVALWLALFVGAFVALIGAAVVAGRPDESSAGQFVVVLAGLGIVCVGVAVPLYAVGVRVG